MFVQHTAILHTMPSCPKHNSLHPASFWLHEKLATVVFKNPSSVITFNEKSDVIANNECEWSIMRSSIF